MKSGGSRMAPTSVASKEQWVESDRQRDAARALEVVNAQLVSAAVDPYAWTWVLLSVHRAVRTFLLAGSGAPDGHPIATPLPGLRVRGPDDGAGDLVTRYERAATDAGLDAFPAVCDGLARFTRIYDELERLPEGWALRLNDLPHTTRSCLKVCEQLGWGPGVIRWTDERIVELARAKYAGSVRILDALHGEYNGD